MLDRTALLERTALAWAGMGLVALCRSFADSPVERPLALHGSLVLLARRPA